MVRHPCLICSVAVLFSGGNASPSGSEVPQRKQLPAVCSLPSQGSEGRAGASRDLLADYVISQVQVLMRHGARSNYHHVPNVTNPHVFSCEVRGAELEASLEWPRLLEAVDADSGLPSAPQSPWALETAPDGKTCIEEGGMLLPEGVRWLGAFGTSLQSAYGPFLANLLPEDVYFRSQSVPRVLLSAASLLTGILGETRAAASEISKFKIHIHSNQSDETMQGLPCPRGEQLSSQQDDAFVFPSDLVKDLGRIFSVDDFSSHTKTVDPDIADITFTALCDGGELPCGPGGCVNKTLQARLVETYDAKWREQSSGDLGGAESSKLQLQPLLAEVVGRMSAEPSSRPKLAVYAGRDSVIGPVAGALGIFDGLWPAFSAHIVFELWEPKASAAGTMMVRVLYNGKDVTSLVTGCGGAALCPLSSFGDAVQGLLGSHASHEEACMLKTGHVEVVV